MTQHSVVDRAAWLPHRLELLEREKAFTRAKDELAKARRALPWVRVDKPYVFETTRGKASLAELFGTASQLIVYHFMFGPNADAGCKNCSFWAEHFDAVTRHLPRRDAAFVAVSRGPLAKLQAYKRRLGWGFEWVSSEATDFNFDFGVSFREAERSAGTARYNFAPLDPKMPSELPGFSVFHKGTDGTVFHTYSTYGRGIELVNATYQFLDLLPKGRDEDGLPDPLAWVRRHDEYEERA